MGANAVKARTWFKRPWHHCTSHGGPPRIKWFTVGAAALYRGMMVKLVSGLVVACATDDTALLGVALENAAISAQVPVAVADPGTTFRIRTSGGTTALTSYTIGSLYDVVVAGSGATHECQVDTTSTQSVFAVIGYMPGDNTADTTDAGRLLVNITKSQFWP